MSSWEELDSACREGKFWGVCAVLPALGRRQIWPVLGGSTLRLAFGRQGFLRRGFAAANRSPRTETDLTSLHSAPRRASQFWGDLSPLPAGPSMRSRIAVEHFICGYVGKPLAIGRRPWARLRAGCDGRLHADTDADHVSQGGRRGLGSEGHFGHCMRDPADLPCYRR
eukprot:2668332-Heterocapsa_arctica.AAC.2